MDAELSGARPSGPAGRRGALRRPPRGAAPGIAADGHKHPLGVVEGSTERHGRKDRGWEERHSLHFAKDDGRRGTVRATVPQTVAPRPRARASSLAPARRPRLQPPLSSPAPPQGRRVTVKPLSRRRCPEPPVEGVGNSAGSGQVRGRPRHAELADPHPLPDHVLSCVGRSPRTAQV